MFEPNAILPKTQAELALFLGRSASLALNLEASLTPKPALVDRRGSGAHRDLNLQLLLDSSACLEKYFVEIAQIAQRSDLSSSKLRFALGECGRRAEADMLLTTGGVNTHRGAIWAMGLLVAAVALEPTQIRHSEISRRAAYLAGIPDLQSTSVLSNTTQRPWTQSSSIQSPSTRSPSIQPSSTQSAPTQSTSTQSHGEEVAQRFGFGGARLEATSGFPHVFEIGVSAIRNCQLKGASRENCFLDALLSIMSSLNDTCLLYRGGLRALETAKNGAADVLRLGGASTPRGMERLYQLDHDLLELNCSPGGSADLLAASIFVHLVTLTSDLETVDISMPSKFPVEV